MLVRETDALHLDAGKAIDPFVCNNLLQGDITGGPICVARTSTLWTNYLPLRLARSGETRGRYVLDRASGPL